MPRQMSVSLTEAAVVDRSKTVTRRLGWRFLRPGDRLTLCRKVMGRRRPDGTVEPLVRLADVEVVSVRRERLWDITDEDIAREGVPVDLFDEWRVDTGLPTPEAWVRWFAYAMGCRPDDEVTRIEWRYLDHLVRAIPIKDIAKELSGEEALAAAAMAMEEVALAEALAIIHGKARAAELYVERGGHVRFDENGEPVLLWKAAFAQRSAR
jgi:hypothetical protein